MPTKLEGTVLSVASADDGALCRAALRTHLIRALTRKARSLFMGVPLTLRPPHGASHLQLFAFLSVMFEPTFRLIPHAAGFGVLHRSGPKGTRIVRYRMLDDAGLLAEPIL